MEFVYLMNEEERERSQSVRILNRSIRDSNDPMQLPDAYFVKLYRLSKGSVNLLLTRLGPCLLPRKRYGVHPLIKILASLHFLGHGGYQKAVGHGYTLGLSQPTVSRFLQQVTEGIIQNFMEEAIKFPQTPQEKDRVKDGFYAIYGMPGVLGAIDGTHIAIISPPKDHPTHPGIHFFNREGYFSINCQMVCDSNMKIMNVNANHPGSTHDAAIFQLSQLNSTLRSSYLRGCEEWLLGDSSYTQLPWVMTPVEHPESGAEQRYNRAHMQTRAVIEKCFSVMKNRFQCTLKRNVLHYSPKMAAQIINTVAILHNIALSQSDPMPMEDTVDPVTI